MKNFTAYVEYDPESQLYVGLISTVSGAHTQAATRDELQANLKEVLELCLGELDQSSECDSSGEECPLPF